MESTKLVITKENFRELVTFQQRYPHCEIKLVPRVDSHLPPAESDIPTTEVVEVEEEGDKDEENT